MWRAFFFAIGLFVLLLGAECLVVQEFRLRMKTPPPPAAMATEKASAPVQRVMRPQPWVPWSLMSAGAVVCLYSFTIPRPSGK